VKLTDVCPARRVTSRGLAAEAIHKATAVCLLCGIPHNRHSFASEVAQATKDPALVKELLGHASVVSSDVYLHARWEDMRAAIDTYAGRVER